MTTYRRRYRLRIHDGTSDVADFADPAVATGNEFVVHSVRDAENPYIAEPPEGDGQELDPITGKATIGEVQIRVIDARVGGEAVEVVGYDFDSAVDGNTDWPILKDGGGSDTWQEAGTPFPDLTGGSLYLGVDSAENGLFGGTWRAAHTYGTADGLLPDTDYIVSIYGIVEWNFSQATMSVTANGETVEFPDDYSGTTFLATTDSAGDLEIELVMVMGLGANITTFKVDRLRIYESADYPGRVVTRALADEQGYWHLLSRMAAVELSEDDGEAAVLTWTAVTIGFLNALRLPRALVWDLTVGETRRAELRAELYRESPVPVDTGDVLISPTCLFGGPIVGGAAYNTPEEVFAGVKDYGPMRVEVVAQTGHSARQVDLNLIGAWMAPFYLELRTFAGNGNDDVELSYPNHFAREFFEWDPDTWAYDSGQTSTVYGSFPGLVVQMTRVSDGATFYTFPLAAATRKSSSYLLKPPTDDPVGTYDNLITRGAAELRVDWDAATLGEAKPTAGEQFDIRVWPARPSKDFPIHVKGHPVAIVEYHAATFGVRVDTASAAAAETAINTRYGGTVTVELTYESHISFEKDHRTLLAFFGFALRPTVTGEVEFVGLRYAAPTDSTPITLDDLRDDEAPIFELAEDSIITTAETKALRYLYTIARDGDDVEASFGDFPPDLLLKKDDVVTGATDDTVDAGDQRTHTWELPGRVLVNGIPADTLPMAVAAGDWLVDWRRRGAPEFELHVLPSGDREVGTDIEVNLPHMPTALAARYPVADRGGRITARVLRRTPVVSGADLACILAPPADQAIISAPTGSTPTAPDTVVPEFTLEAWTGDPSRMVWITVTNPDDLSEAGLVVRWEWYAESGTGDRMDDAFGPVDPGVLSEFLIGPAFPEATVYVRAQAVGGAWTAYQSISLEAAPNAVPAPGLAFDALVLAATGVPDITATLTAPAVSVKIAAGTVDGGPPDLATVQAATADAAAPFEATFAALAPGEHVVVGAIALDAGGAESALVTLTIARDAVPSVEDTVDITERDNGDLLYVAIEDGDPVIRYLSIPADWSTVDYVLGIVGGLPAWREAVGTIVVAGGLYPATDLYPDTLLYPEAP